MLLSSTEFRENLQSSLKRAKKEVLVLSGFIKADALRWLLDQCDTNNISVVSRWRKHDLICGASDFECYEICKQAGVRFGVSQNLHGKVYNIDQKIFVGSANLTSRGMAFSNNYNDEFGVGFAAGESDKSKLTSYLNEVIWLNDALAESLRNELDETSSSQMISDQVWSTIVKAQLYNPVKHLWMHELLFSTPADILNFNAENEFQHHDYMLLGLHIDSIHHESLATAFKDSNAFKWVDNLLQHEKSLSFGAISARLHGSILDDPLPYRREVKQLVANLFSWFQLLNSEYTVSRPNYSQVLARR